MAGLRMMACFQPFGQPGMVDVIACDTIGKVWRESVLSLATLTLNRKSRELPNGIYKKIGLFFLRQKPRSWRKAELWFRLCGPFSREKTSLAAHTGTKN